MRNVITSVFMFIIFIYNILSISPGIYMSTKGSDENGDGSISNPYLSLMKCQEMANPGDTVFIMGGIYTNFEIASSSDIYNYVHFFNKNSITYKAYNSEEVIFDFEFSPKYKTKDGIISQRVTGFYIMEGTENVTFEDFSCTRVPTMNSEELKAANKSLSQSECFQSRGKNIRFNRIKAFNNNAIGFYFVGLKSYNIAYRCDAFNNYGNSPETKGNMDGFGAHGTGAEFIECRAWDNSDDNYDCINSYGTSIFDNCWSFRVNFTGSDIQDGNGFKVGGWGKSADARDRYSKFSGENPPLHIVKNCIAANNKANGFYSNHQPGQAAVWFNNRAYNNKANFDMTEGSETWELDTNGKVVDICGTREILFFNIASKFNAKLKECDCCLYGKEGNLYNANLTEEKNQFNSWNYRNITIVNDDFLSLDVKELAKERGIDGSLPKINFMKLNPNSSNYQVLKAIEDEAKNYEVFNNGTIIKIYKEGDGNEPNEQNNDSGISGWAIFGIVTGIIVFIAFIIFLILYMRKKKSDSDENIKNEMQVLN